MPVNKKIKNIKKRGFTIVELLVVVTIIGIMTTVMLVSLAGNKDQNAVNAEGRKLTAILREVQNNSITGKVVNQATPTPLCYSGLIIEPATSELVYKPYQIMRVAGQTNCVSLASNPTVNVITSYTLGNGVKFDTSPSGISIVTNKIVFSTPFGKISYFDGPFNYDYTIQSSSAANYVLVKNNAYYTVCLCPSGNIQEITSKDNCINVCQITPP